MSFFLSLCALLAAPAAGLQVADGTPNGKSDEAATKTDSSTSRLIRKAVAAQRGKHFSEAADFFAKAAERLRKAGKETVAQVRQ